MKEDSVRSVERAFHILKAFTRDDYKLTLSEIAERRNRGKNRTPRHDHPAARGHP